MTPSPRSGSLQRVALAALSTVVLTVGGGAAAAAASGPTATVEIADRLEPSRVTVPAGGTVTWRNADDERHRVRSTAGPEEFDSGNLEPGDTWTETLSVPGEYRYVDARDDDDPAYWGSITVTGQPVSGPASPDGAPALHGADSGTAGAEGGGERVVSLVDRSFSPESVAVPVGATVTWINESDRDHTVTADDGTFDSGELPPGSRYTHTFAQPGSSRPLSSWAHRS